MAFFAGPYSVSYGGTSIGKIAAEDGIVIEQTAIKQLIRGDNLAQTVQDAVYQGMDVFAEFTLIEFENAVAQDALWPYDTAAPGDMGQVGRLDVALTKQLLFTAVAGTEAAGGAWFTITCDRAIVAEGFPLRLLFGARLNAIPMRMRLYPNASDIFYTPAAAP